MVTLDHVFFMQKLKTIRHCVNGHQFIKSSDCFVCPVCEKSKPTNNLFLKQFSAPARRALEKLDIKSIQDVCNYKEKEITNTHGIGPKAIEIIKTLIKEHNINFKSNG
jgi:DNA-directed RNA polymerase alpha subunit